jgi:hypothetical protein
MDSRLISNLGAAIHPAQTSPPITRAPVGIPPTAPSCTTGPGSMPAPAPLATQPGPALGSAPITPSERMPARPQHSTRAQTEPQSTSQVHCPLTVTPYPSTATAQSAIKTARTLPAPAQKVTKAANTLGPPRTPSRSTPPHHNPHCQHARQRPVSKPARHTATQDKDACHPLRNQGLNAAVRFRTPNQTAARHNTQRSLHTSPECIQ